ncbi:hypothetical protein QRD43_20860 [Pelomonas sp. APW6]|uniref:Uncharacterized protein n=1 Tax=Roseateles subflavus TaxID=3053353 RepID=A0ABT7LNB1_9BURK|nr:hypothetical protein [Pelomonas sp. APW6]MDL5034366.1 hypothetical protein [Pelomonas sp. APW6]
MPISAVALTALLNEHPAARSTLKHLVIVEQTLKLAKVDPFSYIPAQVLSHALRQLERLGGGQHLSGELGLLHLQMRRKAQEHEMRAQAFAEQRSAADGQESEDLCSISKKDGSNLPFAPASNLMADLFPADTGHPLQARDFADTQPLEVLTDWRR